MRYIMPVVEQLDRATRELKTDHPINNRLALILIDNAAELILHRRCEMHARFAKEFLKLGKEKLSLKQRKMAVGPHLEGKLRVLLDVGEITEDERQFISICHNYRNELYHVGLKHEEVIRAFAGRYYKLACDLFKRLPPDYVGWSSEDEVTEVGKRYLEKLEGGGVLAIKVEALAPLLLAKLPEMPKLSETLTLAASDSIEQIEETFQFLIQNNPSGMKATEVLREGQFYYDFLARAEKNGIVGASWDSTYRKRITELRNEMRKSWRSRYKRIPVTEWRERAKAISAVADDLKASASYQALRNDMAYLETVLGDAAAELDAWIQLEIDHARGR